MAPTPLPQQAWLAFDAVRNVPALLGVPGFEPEVFLVFYRSFADLERALHVMAHPPARGVGIPAWKVLDTMPRPSARTVWCEAVSAYGCVLHDIARGDAGDWVIGPCIVTPAGETDA